MAQKIHALDSLRTRSLIPPEYGQSEDRQLEDENIVISTKPNANLKSIVKKTKKGNIQRLKVLRFAQPLAKTFVVENWKHYNLNIDEQSESCCQTF